MKTTRNILLATSLMFVLLHSFLPHVHQTDQARNVGASFYHNTETIAGILQAICTDIGKGHLEHFQAAKDLDFSTNALNFTVLFQFQRQFESFVLKAFADKEPKSQRLFSHFCQKTQSAQSSPTIGRAPPFGAIQLS